ncbi:MAG: ABC transporter substrate-binding protein [Thermodesulfovibrio sp.]|nr:ABC transporter substrate-binding protein [Thermodesulfovibrio sp.]
MENNKAGGWSRREFIGGLALAGTAAILGLRPEPGMAAAEPLPETRTLRLRYWDPACWAPFYLAEPLLREEGFTDIRYIAGPPQELVDMFKKGLVDLSPDFSVHGMYNIEAEGSSQKFIAGLHVGCYALIGSERIRSVRDLKGKTVWTGPVENNGPHLFFQAIVSYVGLDPRKDIKYVWVKRDEAMSLFQQGKIDAFISFPPGPQELMAKGIGRLLLDTNVDKPWSQYFCCMVSGQSDFVKNNPIAAKRALRAILKAVDLVSRDPAKAAHELLARKIVKQKDEKYVLQSLKEIPYDRWREYNPEDTIRFFALRMRETGMMKSNPQQFIERHTDWRFIRELKKEFGITAW